MRALLAGARRKQPAMQDLLSKLVLAESPSDNKAAVDDCMDLASAHANALGGRVKLHRQRAYGDVLEARFGLNSKAKQCCGWSGGEADPAPGPFGHSVAAGDAQDDAAAPVDGRIWGPEHST